MKLLLKKVLKISKSNNQRVVCHKIAEWPETGGTHVISAT